MEKAAKRFEKAGLTVCGEDAVRLTRKGFLVSNTLIAELLYSD
jgi:coproporphyrinogen III oxidase-like Fe-S oxidoreductase